MCIRDSPCEGERALLPLEEILVLHLEDLFELHRIQAVAAFRVTRNSDLAIDEEAEDLLGRSSYHRCWKTLGGESSIESIGPQTLSLYGYSREGDLVLDLTITSGQYIRLNDRVYEMGQFGATPAAELVQKLSQALGFATF